MENKFCIKTARQKRAILALLEKSISVKDLGPIIGALNPRQTISELRQQGFRGIIKTKRFTIIDQDGKKCRPGEYFVPQEFKPILERVLKENYYLPTLKKPEAMQDKAFQIHNTRRS